MRFRARAGAPVLLAALVVAVAVALTGFGIGPGGPGAITGASGSPGASGGANGPGETGPGDTGAVPSLPPPTPSPRPPIGGTELYGYLPYWQMTGSVAAYLRDVPVTTLALFSVTARPDGRLDTRQTGYRRITGAIGDRLIREAHARGVRVELVFTSFDAGRNARFFGRAVEPASSPASSPGSSPGSSPAGAGPGAPSTSPSPGPAPRPAPWRRAVGELVDLVVDLGLDGLNVDVERLDDLDRPAYGEFLRALDANLASAAPKASLSVATEASVRGAANAAAATESGVDRIFLMGYDYHWSDSLPGASAPIDRSDGLMTLTWSIDQYVALGVPRSRVLLGLPLYGMTWKVGGPDRTSLVIGRGASWVPARHLDTLLAPGFRPERDALEWAEFFVVPEGDAWRITYYDSPATLRAKLALARDAGLAGGGFWALGYERGLPGYRELMADFRAGRVDRDDLRPRP